MTTIPQCQKKATGCFCDNVYVKNTLYTDLIQPKTAGGTVSIPSLVIPSIDCLTLNANQTIVGCGADGSGGTGNTAVGVNALSVATGNNNTSVGNSSGGSLTTGDNNTAVGNSSGSSLTTGSNNVLNGFEAGLNLTTGGGNTLIGSLSGNALTTSEANTAVGISTLTIATGDGNTALGAIAGFSLTTGEFNTLLGYGAGSGMSGNLNGCVLIGNRAGVNNTVADRLMIDNTNTDEPLIDGNFAGDTLQINGTVTLGTDSTTPIHVLNVSEVPLTLENDAGYIRLNVNGTVKRIKLYDDVNPP